MRRREFLGLVAGAATWPLAARAQQPERMRRVGILTNLPRTDPEGEVRLQAFRGSLQKLGWTEGRDIQFEHRSYSGNSALARTYAAELVALRPDVIFAAPSSALAALQPQTRDIPIVFAQVGEPVGSGFVDSLARPGGNITGFATTEFALGAKWVELLTQLAPSVKRAAVFYDPNNPSAAGYLPLIDAAARRFNIQITTAVVRDAADIERVIDTFAREPNGGLIPIAGPLTVIRRDLIISLANRFRLPTVFTYRLFAAAGGLASYGVDNIETYRLAGSYVDRILKGEKPSGLPVQMPTKIELVINLRTAKALGLDVPATLLARADEIIE